MFPSTLPSLAPAFDIMAAHPDCPVAFLADTAERGARPSVSRGNDYTWTPVWFRREPNPST